VTAGRAEARADDIGQMEGWRRRDVLAHHRPIEYSVRVYMHSSTHVNNLLGNVISYRLEHAASSRKLCQPPHLIVLPISEQDFAVYIK